MTEHGSEAVFTICATILILAFMACCFRECHAARERPPAPAAERAPR